MRWRTRGYGHFLWDRILRSGLWSFNVPSCSSMKKRGIAMTSHDEWAGWFSSPMLYGGDGTMATLDDALSHTYIHSLA
jgi:hypothetical protein